MILEYVLPKPSIERVVFVGDQEALTRYPIMVLNAGNSRWVGDARIRLADSHQCVIELITAGDCRFEQNGKEYIVAPGMAFIQRKHQSVFYCTGPAGFVHKRFIGFSGNLMEVLLEKLGLTRIDVVGLSNAMPLIRAMKRIRRVLEERPAGYQGTLSLLAYELLMLVADESAQVIYPAEIQAAINFMQRNFDKKLSTGDMAREVGMSEPHLYRLFRKHVHDTPNSFFMSMKLKHAAQIIRYTQTSMKEVALFHGFDDPSYFSKTFRKIIGTSPQEYREMSRQ